MYGISRFPRDSVAANRQSVFDSHLSHNRVMSGGRAHVLPEGNLLGQEALPAVTLATNMHLSRLPSLLFCESPNDGWCGATTRRGIQFDV